jgi:hypothetical protein
MEVMKMNEVFLFLNGDVVESIHYKPYDDKFGIVGKVENLEEKGVFYSKELPVIEQRFGKSPIMKYNKQTDEVYVEYVERPLTPEEKLQLLEQENQDLKNRIDLMQQALDELLLGGGM